jgi:hypothetical protein
MAGKSSSAVEQQRSRTPNTTAAQQKEAGKEEGKARFSPEKEGKKSGDERVRTGTCGFSGGGRKNKVSRLPAGLREEVESLLLDPNNTFEDVSLYLKERGHDISRWSVGRYSEAFFARMERMREIEDKGRMLMEEAGGSIAFLEQAAARMLSEKILRLLLQDELSPKDLSLMVQIFARHQRARMNLQALKERPVAFKEGG